MSGANEANCNVLATVLPPNTMPFKCGITTYQALVVKVRVCGNEVV